MGLRTELNMMGVSSGCLALVGVTGVVDLGRTCVTLGDRAWRMRRGLTSATFTVMLTWPRSHLEVV